MSTRTGGGWTDKGWTGGVRPWSTRRNATGQLTARQRAAMLAAADEQARERQAAAERHRRLRGQSANKRSAARRRRRTGRRHRREWDASAAAEAALAGSGAASARLTAGRADRMTASTAQSEFIGQDVLYVTPGHSKKNTVRAVTWNAGKAFRGAKFDFFLDYITAREDDAGTRPGFDFASVQELGPSWARGGQAWLWQTPGQKARARAVAEKPGMDTPTSARQRRQRSREVWAAEKEPEPGRNTGWRSCFTQHAMLAWRAEWESRRWGQPTVTPDGRTIGAQFSTATGRVGVISHYGLAAPAQLEEEESAAHGMNSANVQRGLLDMLADFKDNCKLVVVLGDLNVQRRQDRLDLDESGAPDVAHKLWLRLTKGGGLVCPLQEMGVRQVWTRSRAVRMRRGPALSRTRPDWALVAADWDRWKIRRSGVHVGNESFDAFSDHKPVLIEIKAVARDHGVDKRRRVHPKDFFAVGKLTETQERCWRQSVMKLEYTTPTAENWRREGRSFYDDFFGKLTRLGSDLFGGKTGLKPRSGRPFWDKESGVAARQMGVMVKLRSNLRRLARQAGTPQRELADSEEYLRRKARRHRHLPEEVRLDGSRSDLIAQLEEEIGKRKRLLSKRQRQQRIAGGRSIQGLWKKGRMGAAISRALHRKGGGRDPYAAVVADGSGEAVVTSHPEVVKAAASQVAADWFTSIRNPARFRVRWAPQTAQEDRRSTLREMRQRKGYRCWGSKDPLMCAAAAAFQHRPGEENAAGHTVLTAADVEWLGRRVEVAAVDHHSSPYMVWFNPRVDEDTADAEWAVVEAMTDDCNLERISDPYRTAMGLTHTRWMSHAQRARMASKRQEVLAVIPLPPMAFLVNSEESAAGLPSPVAAAFGVRGMRDDKQVGNHKVDQRKRKTMNDLLQKEKFAELFDKAWKRVRKKAAAGRDHLTKSLIVAAQHAFGAMSEYFRLGIRNMDLSTSMTVSVLKWLPKDGRKSPYLDMTTRTPPNKRPIGLNTLGSKLLEHILFQMQAEMNGEAEVVHDFMFAWHRGRVAYSAALMDLLIVEDAARRGAELHTASFDSMHWYDTVHLATSIMTERRLGYPPELMYAKAAIRTGEIWVRTEAGLAGPVYVEQGLGQGRVEAPSDSNRYDMGVMTALAHADPYVLHAGTHYQVPVMMLHYADDRRAYSGSAAGLGSHAMRMLRIHLHDGGAFKAKKGYQGNVNTTAADSLRPIWDPTQGGEAPIPRVGREEAKRFLGHYVDLLGSSEAGADILLAECLDDIRALSRPAVEWPVFRMVVSSVLGGRVRYKSTLTRGMRRACRQIEQAVSAVALVKRGERSTSSRAHLYVKDGVGAGLCSVYDIYLSSLVAGQVAAARCGGVEERGMRGAMAAYACDRGTTLAWSRCRAIQALSGSGDDTVPERGHVALSAVGLVAAPSKLEPRWTDGDFDQAVDVHLDGGRWADWRLMDLLPQEVVEATWQWCRSVGLRWVSQLMDGSGVKALPLQGWLRSLKVTGIPAAAVRVHEATSMMVRDGDWAVSPLASRGLKDFEVLKVGQFALVSRRGEGDAKYEVLPGYRLVQGVDASGGVGGTFQPGGVAYTGGCEDCRSGVCAKGTHAPAGVRWSATAGEWQVRVRQLRYWPLRDDPQGPSTGVYAPESHWLRWLTLPDIFHVVEPHVAQHSDNAVGLIPVIPPPHMDGWTVTRRGRPATRGQWRDTATDRITFWKERSGFDQGWRCQLCGREESRASKRQGTTHRACANYHDRWRKLVLGHLQRWVYKHKGKETGLSGLFLDRTTKGPQVYATDGSVVVRTALSGERTVEAGCAVVSAAAGHPEVQVSLRGRPEELRKSYYAELAALIVLHLVADPDHEHTWVGDNRSVVKLYKSIVEHGWLYSARQLEHMPARSMTRWLVRLATNARFPFKAVHQISHLSESNVLQRRRDHRVILGKADSAAASARRSTTHVLNVSGCNPGVGPIEVYDSATGYRVDGPVGPEVERRRQCAHVDKWKKLKRHGLYLRLPGVETAAMSWRGEPESSGATRNFISRLLRSALPTAADRERWDSSESGACWVAKYGWEEYQEGDQIEVLAVAGDGQAWTIASLRHGVHRYTEDLEVSIRGSTMMLPVWMARHGRWTTQTISSTVGASLEEVDTGSGPWHSGEAMRGWRHLLWHGFAKQVKRLAVAAAAVLRCEEWQAVVEEEPYARAVAAAICAGGHEVMASTVQLLQDGVQVWLSRRLAGWLQRDLPGALTAPERMVVCCLLRWPHATSGAVMSEAVCALQHWAAGTAGHEHALPGGAGAACKKAADQLHGVLESQPACSRLDRRLQRLVADTPPGMAVVEERMEELAAGARPLSELVEEMCGRDGMCSDIEPRRVGGNDSERRRLWHLSTEASDHVGWGKNESSLRPLMAKLDREAAYVSKGELSHVELPEVVQPPGWRRLPDQQREVGKAKELSTGGTERKVEMFPGPWVRAGRRLSDRQMRVWSVVGGAVALNEAWRKLPGRATTVARPALVRLVALGAGGDGVSLVGVEPWSPYVTTAAQYAYPGSPACASLGIRAFDRQLTGLVFVVSQANKKLVNWATHRTGGTLMVVHGQDVAAHGHGVVLVRFPASTYCPLPQRSAAGSCTSAVGYDTVVRESVRLVAFGVQPRRRVVLQSHLKEYAAGWLRGSPALEWPRVAPAAVGTHEYSGLHTVSEQVLRGCAHWQCSVMTTAVRRSLGLHGVRGRQVAAVMKRWHVCISESLHAKWRRMRRVRDLLTLRCGGERTEWRHKRRVREKRLLAAGPSLQEARGDQDKQRGGRSAAKVRLKAAQQMGRDLERWATSGQAAPAEAAKHLRMEARHQPDLQRGMSSTGLPLAIVTQLTLSGYVEMEDHELVATVARCPEARMLRLVGCAQVTTAGLRTMAQGSPEVRKLCLSSCGAVSGESLARLRAEMDLRVEVHNCAQVSESMARRWRRSDQGRTRRTAARAAGQQAAAGAFGDSFIVIGAMRVTDKSRLDRRRRRWRGKLRLENLGMRLPPAALTTVQRMARQIPHRRDAARVRRAVAGAAEQAARAMAAVGASLATAREADIGGPWGRQLSQGYLDLALGVCGASEEHAMVCARATRAAAYDHMGRRGLFRGRQRRQQAVRLLHRECPTWGLWWATLRAVDAVIARASGTTDGGLNTVTDVTSARAQQVGSPPRVFLERARRQAGDGTQGTGDGQPFPAHDPVAVARGRAAKNAAKAARRAARAANRGARASSKAAGSVSAAARDVLAEGTQRRDQGDGAQRAVDSDDESLLVLKKAIQRESRRRRGRAAQHRRGLQGTETPRTSDEGEGNLHLGRNAGRRGGPRGAAATPSEGGAVSGTTEQQDINITGNLESQDGHGHHGGLDRPARGGDAKTSDGTCRRR